MCAFSLWIFSSFFSCCLPCSFVANGNAAAAAALHYIRVRVSALTIATSTYILSCFSFSLLTKESSLFVAAFRTQRRWRWWYHPFELAVCYIPLFLLLEIFFSLSSRVWCFYFPPLCSVLLVPTNSSEIVVGRAAFAEDGYIRSRRMVVVVSTDGNGRWCSLLLFIFVVCFAVVASFTRASCHCKALFGGWKISVFIHTLLLCIAVPHSTHSLCVYCCCCCCFSSVLIFLYIHRVFVLQFFSFLRYEFNISLSSNRLHFSCCSLLTINVLFSIRYTYETSN